MSAPEPKVEPKTGPCAGLTVLDLSTMVAGPVCGLILADMGADVIKVETPQGDMMRTVPPLHNGMSAYFAQSNRNKRSIVLDLKTKAGRAAAQDLAAEADIVLENYRPGVAARLGMSYETLKARNRSLIYVSVNGYGTDGPYVEQPAYDQVMQALVGFMPMQGSADEPSPIYSPIADKVAAMSAAIATLGAVVHRQANGGEGQWVNVKMLDAWAAFILPELINSRYFGDQTVETKTPPRYRLFKTSDGFAHGVLIQVNQFQGLCDALNRPDLKTDPRFATSASLIGHALAIRDLFAEQVAQMTTAEFVAAARAHHVPFAPVNDLQAFFDDPQVKHNQTYFDVDDPDYGPMRNLAFMAEFGSTPAGFQRRAPRLGEHTDEVLRAIGKKRKPPAKP